MKTRKYRTSMGRQTARIGAHWKLDPARICIALPRMKMSRKAAIATPGIMARVAPRRPRAAVRAEKKAGPNARPNAPELIKTAMARPRCERTDAVAFAAAWG